MHRPFYAWLADGEVYAERLRRDAHLRVLSFCRVPRSTRAIFGVHGTMARNLAYRLRDRGLLARRDDGRLITTPGGMNYLRARLRRGRRKTRNQLLQQRVVDVDPSEVNAWLAVGGGRVRAVWMPRGTAAAAGRPPDRP